MFRVYVRERLSWMLMFSSLAALLLFISYLDPGVSMDSILYYIFLSFIMFAIFFLLRYRKETKFYRELIEQYDMISHSFVPECTSPFEKITADTLMNQVELLKKRSEQSNRELELEKDDLLSWIHEVKTPLTSLRLMLDRIDDPALKKNMTFEWLRIHLLLDQQLHQKRIPFMEKDLFMEVVDLESVIFKEIKTLQSWCIQKGIGFQLDLDASKIVSDAKWLAFILRQLLTNAVKYSDSSDIHIRSFKKNGTLVLEIEDFGRGIDPKDMPRIFEKGFTSTVHHQDPSSTGMGLFLAKKAAAPLQIVIHATSQPGAGTIFSLNFPVSNQYTQFLGM